MMMLDIEQTQPALLAHGQCDKAAKLDQFRLREVLVEPLPKRVISINVPGDRLGVRKRRFLPFILTRRLLKIEQVVILRLFEAGLGGFERALVAAVLAVNRSRNIDPAEFFDAMIADAVLEYVVPGIGE